MSWTLRFLGVGSAQATAQLGSACSVLEHDGEPVLMIDCGQEALTAFLDHYGEPPSAIYITHTHMDHVGGIERLFYKIYFDARLRGTVRLYAHAALVPLLQARIADYPEVIAEGGANFWDAFALIPLSRGFWHRDVWFDVFPTRHHAPGTSFGIALPGSFVWTGDTRPIPEMLAQHAAHGTSEVSANIGNVQRGAGETGAASAQVHSAAQSLSQESNRLKSEVARFLESVRAA